MVRFREKMDLFNEFSINIFFLFMISFFIFYYIVWECRVKWDKISYISGLMCFSFSIYLREGWIRN